MSDEREISDLGDGELSCAVAERVMGWRRERSTMHGKPQYVWIDQHGNTRSIYCGCDEDFTPSTSIDDAMAVWEYLRHSDQWCCLSIGSDHGYCWRLYLTPTATDDEEENGTYEHKAVICTDGESNLPRAICRAALMAQDYLATLGKGVAAEAVKNNQPD